MDKLAEEVIRDAAKGNIQAFETLYRESFSLVRDVALRLLRNREDAEEMVQEVFVKVYQKLPEFRFQSAFKTWVYRITVNDCLNHIKRAARTRDNLQEVMTEAPSSTLPEVRAKWEEEEKAHTIERLLAQLNPDQRACILLRSVEGLSYEEIANTLQIPINTVRSRIKRARESMMAFAKQEASHEM